jgi:hypothetical protein
MSTTHIIQTVIEVLLIVAVIVGFVYEPVLAEWEEKQGKKMLGAFNKRKDFRK